MSFSRHSGDSLNERVIKQENHVPVSYDPNKVRHMSIDSSISSWSSSSTHSNCPKNNRNEFTTNKIEGLISLIENPKLFVLVRDCMKDTHENVEKKIMERSSESNFEKDFLNLTLSTTCSESFHNRSVSNSSEQFECVAVAPASKRLTRSQIKKSTDNIVKPNIGEDRPPIPVLKIKRKCLPEIENSVTSKKLKETGTSKESRVTGSCMSKPKPKQKKIDQAYRSKKRRTCGRKTSNTVKRNQSNCLNPTKKCSVKVVKTSIVPADDINFQSINTEGRDVIKNSKKEVTETDPLIIKNVEQQIEKPIMNFIIENVNESLDTSGLRIVIPDNSNIEGSTISEGKKIPIKKRYRIRNEFTQSKVKPIAYSLPDLCQPDLKTPFNIPSARRTKKSDALYAPIDPNKLMKKRGRAVTKVKTELKTIAKKQTKVKVPLKKKVFLPPTPPPEYPCLGNTPIICRIPLRRIRRIRHVIKFRPKMENAVHINTNKAKKAIYSDPFEETPKTVSKSDIVVSHTREIASKIDEWFSKNEVTVVEDTVPDILQEFDTHQQNPPDCSLLHQIVSPKDATPCVSSINDSNYCRSNQSAAYNYPSENQLLNLVIHQRSEIESQTFLPLDLTLVTRYRNRPSVRMENYDNSSSNFNRYTYCSTNFNNVQSPRATPINLIAPSQPNRSSPDRCQNTIQQTVEEPQLERMRSLSPIEFRDDEISLFVESEFLSSDSDVGKADDMDLDVELNERNLNTPEINLQADTHSSRKAIIIEAAPVNIIDECPEIHDNSDHSMFNTTISNKPATDPVRHIFKPPPEELNKIKRTVINSTAPVTLSSSTAFQIAPTVSTSVHQQCPSMQFPPLHFAPIVSKNEQFCSQNVIASQSSSLNSYGRYSIVTNELPQMPKLIPFREMRPASSTSNNYAIPEAQHFWTQSIPPGPKPMPMVSQILPKEKLPPISTLKIPKLKSSASSKSHELTQQNHTELVDPTMQNIRKKVCQIFGRPCFRFLNGHCATVLCKYRHDELLEPEQVMLSLVSQNLNVIDNAYEMILAHEKMTDKYFHIFCMIYGKFQMVDKLVTMIAHCAGRNDSMKFYTYVMNGLLLCQLSNRHCLEMLIHHTSKSNRPFPSLEIATLMIDYDLVLFFLPTLETILNDPKFPLMPDLFNRLLNIALTTKDHSLSMILMVIVNKGEIFTNAFMSELDMTLVKSFLNMVKEHQTVPSTIPYESSAQVLPANLINNHV